MLSNSEAQIENGVPYKKCVMQCLPWRTSTQVQNTITHYFKLNSIPGQDILSKQQNNYTQGRNGSKTLIARTWKKDLNNFGSLLLFLGHENSYTPWLILSGRKKRGVNHLTIKRTRFLLFQRNFCTKAYEIFDFL